MKMDPHLRAWLVQHGHWEAYQARYRELKALNVDRRDIAFALDKEFGPSRQNKPYVPLESLMRIKPPAEAAMPSVEPTPPVSPGQAPTPAPAADPRYVNPSLWVGKPAPTQREVIDWVFQSLYAANVTPETAPSLGAWGMLQECRASTKFRQTFLDTIWPKTLPRELDPAEDRWTDKCEKANNVIDKILAAKDRAEAASV